MISGSLKVFSGNSNKPFALDVCKALKIELGSATVNSFPDGETFVQINDNIRGADVFIIQSTSQPANHNLMELLIMIDAAKRASAARITAIIPFYGYARQDRKNRPRVPITAKLTANLLFAAGVSRVLTMDLHAQQIVGFFDVPVDHLFAASIFYEYLKRYRHDNLTVISPDSGGMKMAAAYAELLNCPMGMVIKKRKNAEQVEALDLIGQVDNRDALIVDDMIESGSTVVAAAKLLRQRGALCIRAAIAHGVLNSKGYELLKSGAIDELIITDSVFLDSSHNLPITVLSAAHLFAQAIMCIHRNESISDLFLVEK